MSGQQTNDLSKIFTCPRCGAQCKVPAEKGHIRITCPKCMGYFEANS